MRRGASITCVALTFGCVSACHRGANEQRTSTPLRADFAGCVAVQEGPICELPEDGTLRLWIEGPADVALHAEGPLTPLRVVPIANGTLYWVKVPASATSLIASRQSGEFKYEFRLTLVRAPISGLLSEARALRKKGELEKAATLLEAQIAGLNEPERARAMSLLARVELALGHTGASVTLFRESIRQHHALRRVSDEANDSFALAFALAHAFRFSEAREVLAQAEGAYVKYPEGGVNAEYYQGVLARQTGDLLGAIEHDRQVRDRASALGDARLERAARQAMALTVWDMGRASETIAELEALAESPDAEPCERAQLLSNLGYYALRWREDSAVDSREKKPNPEAWLEGALRVYREACAMPRGEADVFVHLAFAALAKGDAERARAHLAESKQRVREPDTLLALEWLELEARVFLLQHVSLRAVPLFERQATLARAGMAYAAWWRALVGKAEALELAGNVQGALVSYADAENVLEENAVAIPSTEGRDVFLGGRERSARGRVELLLRTKRYDEALSAARRARARSITALERHDRIARLAGAELREWEDAMGAYRRAREELDREAAQDWQIPPSELKAVLARRAARDAEIRRALGKAFALLERGSGRENAQRSAKRPAEGEVLLAYFPVRQGWAGFAADVHTTLAARLGPIDLKSTPLSESLLVPFRTLLDHAERIRVLPYGILRDVDFHALSWNGDALVAHAPVEYALDVHPSPSRTEARSLVGRALVLADPMGNLPAAEHEAALVGSALRDAGAVSVRTLRGRTANRASVWSALIEADFFHYAGHGLFAGRGGWESALLLASGGRITVGDILALPRVPEHVVLSGCETARSSRDAPEEGLGLANAFVAAGATSVIASTRVLDDAFASEWIDALYRALSSQDNEDDAAALRRAALEVRSRGGDWSAFRAVVP